MHFFPTQHARDQVLIRYSFEPTNLQWCEAFVDILCRQSLLARRDNDRETHYVKIGGVAVRAVCSIHQAKFITVLPLRNGRRHP